MSSILIRNQGPRRTDRGRTSRKTSGYPHDMLHPDRSWEEQQRDIGGSLFLGAIVLIALMGLIVFGLVG